MNNHDHKKVEQPLAMKITEIKDEAKDIKTFTFKHNVNAKPGQFIMLWLPRINMKPFGVSYQDENRFSATICKVGPFTEELFKKKVGDYVGIQGPYGTGFLTGKKNAILVAGGYGTAPLAFLADVLVNEGAKVTLIIGARTENLIVYRQRFEKSKVKLLVCTDDGTCGRKGYTTDALKEILEKDSTIDMVYTVGPEIMMKKVIELADEHNIDCQASLERYIKCGFGVCGQCVCDDSGVRVCRSGPVFNKEYIKTHINEFGKYHRDGTGKKCC